MTTRTTKHRRTLLLAGLGAAAAAVLVTDGALTPGSGVAITSPAYAQAVKPEELAAEWDKSWTSSIGYSADVYEKLYKWCLEKKLGFTAINVRRLVLRYEPDNKEVREFVGYGKAPDGTWIRNEDRRDKIREEADIEDPKAQKFNEQLISKTKTVVQKWKALASKAMKNAKDDAANASEWNEKAKRAWERVLQADSSNEEAHKSMGHPKFAGKYVRPEALPFLKGRDERKVAGQKHGQLAFKVQPIEPDGMFKAAGLTGGAAKSEHIKVVTSHGKDVAARIALWGERGLQDFVEIYGFNPEIKERIAINVFYHVKDKPELETFLGKGAGWDNAKIQQYTKIFGGMTLGNGECVSIRSGGTDADDHCLHYIGHGITEGGRNMSLPEIGNPNEGIEDWFQETVAYDLTRRLTGTTMTSCGQFGKYGNDLEPKPEKDIWIELAKRQVEYDDDVPLARIWKLKLSDQNIRGPEIVKGYAFLQFLFEDDAEKARQWVKHALVQGTPAAVEAVYGMTMDELDEKYRKWIIASW